MLIRYRIIVNSQELLWVLGMECVCRVWVYHFVSSVCIWQTTGAILPVSTLLVMELMGSKHETQLKYALDVFIIVIFQYIMAVEGMAVQRCKLGDTMYTWICNIPLCWNGSWLLGQHCLPDTRRCFLWPKPSPALYDSDHLHSWYMAASHCWHSEVFCSQSQERSHHWWTFQHE